MQFISIIETANTRGNGLFLNNWYLLKVKGKWSEICQILWITYNGNCPNKLNFKLLNLSIKQNLSAFSLTILAKFYSKDSIIWQCFFLKNSIIKCLHQNGKMACLISLEILKWKWILLLLIWKWISYLPSSWLKWIGKFWLVLRFKFARITHQLCFLNFLSFIHEAYINLHSFWYIWINLWFNQLQ